MSDKVDGVRLQREFLEQLGRRLLLRVKAVHGLGHFFVVILHKDEEVLAPSLLKETHQIGLECLAVRGWHLHWHCKSTL